MELKKTPKADLENKRNIFIQIGLVIALGIVFHGFQYSRHVLSSAYTFGDWTLQQLKTR
jgi:periplasmic protein TonB